MATPRFLEAWSNRKLIAVDIICLFVRSKHLSGDSSQQQSDDCPDFIVDKSQDFM